MPSPAYGKKGKLEKSRESSRRFRAQQKQYTEELRDEAQRVSSENEQLASLNARLARENKAMQDNLLFMSMMAQLSLEAGRHSVPGGALARTVERAASNPDQLLEQVTAARDNTGEASEPCANQGSLPPELSLPFESGYQSQHQQQQFLTAFAAAMTNVAVAGGQGQVVSSATSHPMSVKK